MKCKTCKNRMTDILASLDYTFNGETKKAVNVPACQCLQCKKVIVPDLILGKLEAYAEWESGKIIDYAKCEQKEAEIFTVVHTFKNTLGL